MKKLLLNISSHHIIFLEEESNLSRKFLCMLIIMIFKRIVILPGRCQSMFLRQMKLGPNIASNAALRENVFMMVVCIELRIPLFLVGKPGSSKSLAKSIIADSMQGRTSHSTFLKELKQVNSGRKHFKNIFLFFTGKDVLLSV